MVVVGAPALAENRGRAIAIAVIEESLPIDVHAGDRDAEILFPLRRKVVAYRFVEWVCVIAVREPFHFRAVRVPRQVLRLRRGRVELCVAVGIVAELALW